MSVFSQSRLPLSLLLLLPIQQRVNLHTAINQYQQQSIIVQAPPQSSPSPSCPAACQSAHSNQSTKAAINHCPDSCSVFSFSFLSSSVSICAQQSINNSSNQSQSRLPLSLLRLLPVQQRINLHTAIKQQQQQSINNSNNQSTTATINQQQQQSIMVQAPAQSSPPPSCRAALNLRKAINHQQQQSINNNHNQSTTTTINHSLCSRSVFSFSFLSSSESICNSNQSILTLVINHCPSSRLAFSFSFLFSRLSICTQQSINSNRNQSQFRIPLSLLLFLPVQQRVNLHTAINQQQQKSILVQAPSQSSPFTSCPAACQYAPHSNQSRTAAINHTSRLHLSLLLPIQQRVNLRFRRSISLFMI